MVYLSLHKFSLVFLLELLKMDIVYELEKIQGPLTSCSLHAV